MIGSIVVGAGAAGLGAATALAQSGSVVVVDRIPVAGGAARYDRADVREAVAGAERAGVGFLLGATASRWDRGRLLVCAPGEIRWLDAGRLVFAGGLRPATPAELGITGDRPAGVLPVSVAKHLLEATSTLWRRVAIVGDGPGAGDAAALIAAGSGSIVYVGGGARSPEWATIARVGWRATAVVGRRHVVGVRIRRDDEFELLDCDAVLLAGARPVRNVDGAISDDAKGVLYVQEIAAPAFRQTLRIAGELAQRNRSAVSAVSA